MTDTLATTSMSHSERY